MKHVLVSIRITVVLLVLTCGIYPALVWAVGQFAFRDQANGSLLVRKLYARSVEVRTAGAAGAARAPLSFAPPYPIRLEDGRIGTFTQGPISRKTGDLVLRDIVLKGEGDKKSWRVEKAAVVTQYGAANLAGTLGNEKPYALDLTVGFEGKVQDQDLRVTAKAGVSGRSPWAT